MKVSLMRRLRPLIHKGMNQHMSCSALCSEPLLCSCLGTTFLVIFLGWDSFSHSQASSAVHVGPRITDFSADAEDEIDKLSKSVFKNYHCSCTINHSKTSVAQNYDLTEFYGFYGMRGVLVLKRFSIKSCTDHICPFSSQTKCFNLK